MSASGAGLAKTRTVFFIAARQLWARKLLNGIAVGGVVLGVLMLIAMSGIMEGFQQKFLQSILKVSPHVVLFDKELRPEPPMLARYLKRFVAARVAHESPSDRQTRIKRPHEIARALEGLDGVAAAAPSLGGTVVLDFGGKSKSVDLRGIEPAAQERVTPINQYVVDGSMATLGIASDGLVIGTGVAQDLGVRVGDVVRAAAPGGLPLALKVLATFEAGVPPVDRSRAYVLLRNAQTLLGRPDAIGRIEARLDDPEAAVRAADMAERLFGYDAESWQETNANFLALFTMQNTIIGFVIGAILLVGGFGILAVQIMIVLQKQRDIAILRSVGLRRPDILRIFLLQGTAIALVGGIIGDLAGKIAVIELAKLKVHTEGLVKSETFLIYENPRFYVYGIGFALIVGVVASLLPAWRGSKIEPVDVLRGQIG